jgi:4-hydroxybenzoate polyprenyltransferase
VSPEGARGAGGGGRGGRRPLWRRHPAAAGGESAGAAVPADGTSGAEPTGSAGAAQPAGVSKPAGAAGRGGLSRLAAVAKAVGGGAVAGGSGAASGEARDPRRRNPFRRAGYRLLPGDAFSYVLHLRPAEWPIMAAHTLLGFILSIGLIPFLHGAELGRAVLAVALWVVGLNGGTLALNSVFDQDEGDIGYLRAPPAPPRNLAWFSLGLMVLGFALSFTLPAGYALAYGVCFALSLAYSVPPLRFKAVAGVDWLINMWGFGTLTPYAGWAATGRPLNLMHALVLLAFCPLFASLYPLTQIYQFEEDEERGDRTLALILGLKWSLLVAIAAMLVAFGIFVAAGVLRYASAWQWLALLVAFGAWLWVLVPWYRRRGAMTPAQHQARFYAALGAWAVTDVAVLLAFAL